MVAFTRKMLIRYLADDKIIKSKQQIKRNNIDRDPYVIHVFVQILTHINVHTLKRLFNIIYPVWFVLSYCTL